jgi:uncharacterized protein YndB with AHSA1/START domain
MNNKPFVIEQTYPVPVSRVWQALTDNELMKQWYFNLADFKPEVGFKFEFYGGTKDNQYLHLCEVTEVIPGQKLTHSWAYDGYPGKSYVTFELFDENGQTRLKLTHAGLETFPSANPDFVPSNFAAGWTHITNISLREFLAKA